MRCLAVLVSIAATGCFIPTSSGNDCVPGQSIACAGPNACDGFQVCNPSGTGYGSCVCGVPVPDGGNPNRSGNCDLAEGPVVTVTSPADVQNQILGIWSICGGADEFRARPIELTADGHWFTLVAQGGVFVRAQGPYDTGTFTIEPVSGPTSEWNMNRPGVDYLLRGVLTMSPGGMYLGGGRYVRF